jgi:ketol-acid reductoisomerase
MKNILDDIRSGKWAAAWVEENATGRKGFEATRKRERSHQIEKVGAQLRGMMPFLRPVTITDEEVNSATVSQNG